MNVNNATDLQAAISSGQSDISLAPGGYGPLTLSGVRPQSRVKIGSADPNRRAVFTQFSLFGCANIHLEAIDIFYPDPIEFNSSLAVITIADCRNVSFSSCAAHSYVPNTPLGGRGFYVGDGSQDISIDACSVYDIAKGVVLIGARDVRLTDNHFDRLRSDTMQVSTCSDCIIKNNFGARLYYPQQGDHCDFIQFTGGNSRDFQVSGNVSLLENIGNVQGIFLDDASFDNIEITDNIISTGMGRGITISEGNGNTATFNTVIHIVGSTRSKASIIGGALRSEHNIYSNWKTSSENVVIPLTEYAYSRLYLGVPDGGKLGLKIQDFRPVPGSPAEENGAFMRIHDLISL